ncbi:hypothetical protein AGR7A_pAt30033 [Agrobacterium deltaense NCPPB 1641]|uniref:Uncharacterized protein n=1 Tax=Agrobacterium deltaense NCPPB 1641 TaxID=1183425 RepID=A0A1S7UAI5_9HYPH|nr:hypothetical protein AGR7A_pAt30033 [Agrobacterium deltaense NCPPB 1641]
MPTIVFSMCVVVETEKNVPTTAMYHAPLHTPNRRSSSKKFVVLRKRSRLLDTQSPSSIYKPSMATVRRCKVRDSGLSPQEVAACGAYP